MGLAATLHDELLASHSLALLVVLVASAAVVRTWAPDERRRVRGAVVFTALHLVLLVLTTALRAWGSDDAARVVRVSARMMSVAAFVGLGGVLVFSVVLARIRLSAPRILQDVVMAVAAITAGMFVAAESGFNLSGVIATSAVVTAVIGFSLQDTLGNVMGGLALQLDNSVQVGEWIRVGDLSGRVAEIRWRYTSIHTRDGETVLLPNGVLMKSQVTVLARGLQPGRWRRTVTFLVDFSHQPTDVIEAVESALRAASIPRVAESPPPDCILVELGEAQCRYAVRYWLTDALADGPTDSVVRTRVYFALARARIPLTVRATAVELTQVEARRTDARSADELERCAQALRRIEVLRALDDGEIRQLARDMRYSPFAGGEVMTRQGAEGHWLYLITEGTAAVRVNVDGGLEREVARLGAGQFFGEISLMTGRPREATVVAVTDVECYRLGAEAFRRVLHAHPEKAEDFAEVLAERATALEAVKQGLDAEARQRRAEHHKADLTTKIREFFGLD